MPKVVKMNTAGEGCQPSGLLPQQISGQGILAWDGDRLVPVNNEGHGVGRMPVYDVMNSRPGPFNFPHSHLMPAVYHPVLSFPGPAHRFYGGPYNYMGPFARNEPAFPSSPGVVAMGPTPVFTPAIGITGTAPADILFIDHARPATPVAQQIRELDVPAAPHRGSSGRHLGERDPSDSPLKVHVEGVRQREEKRRSGGHANMQSDTWSPVTMTPFDVEANRRKRVMAALEENRKCELLMSEFMLRNGNHSHDGRQMVKNSPVYEPNIVTRGVARHTAMEEAQEVTRVATEDFITEANNTFSVMNKQIRSIRMLQRGAAEKKDLWYQCSPHVVKCRACCHLGYEDHMCGVRALFIAQSRKGTEYENIDPSRRL